MAPTGELSALSFEEGLRALDTDVHPKRQRSDTPSLVPSSAEEEEMRLLVHQLQQAPRYSFRLPGWTADVDVDKAVEGFARRMEEQRNFQRLNPHARIVYPITQPIYDEDSQSEVPSTKVAARGRTREGIIRQGHSARLQTDREPPRRSKRIAGKTELAVRALLEEKESEKRNIKPNEGTSHDSKRVRRKPASGREDPHKTREKKPKKVTASPEAQMSTMRGKPGKSRLEPKSPHNPRKAEPTKRQAENDSKVSGMHKRRKH